MRMTLLPIAALSLAGGIVLGVAADADTAGEAAHAGDAGKGFAAVAKEVRDLSAAARDTGKSIGYKLGLISTALAQIVTTNERVSSREEAAVTASEQHIHDVLEHFRQRTRLLSEIAARSSAESESIRGEVCEALVQLQFQDRTAQILQQVVASIAQAQQLDTRAGEQTYTTAEQRQTHAGGEADQVAPQGTTFL